VSLRNDNLEIVLVGWVDAQRRNDIEAIEGHLHPEVVWQGLRPDLVCRSRADILDNVRARDGRQPDVAGIELHAEGDQVLFGVRSPDLVDVAGEPLQGQIYEVFTIADGLIVRIDEYRTREEALEVMRQRREALDAGHEPVGRTPPGPVDDLIPFVHVADVGRSVAFYELLGFEVTGTYQPGPQLEWAALEHAQAKLMLAHTDDPVDPARQGVLFYLFTTDLQGLQRHLRAHGEQAGAIVDGTPGPKQEMRVRDPDGYVLMIAART
jgi:hypothetical protein